MDITLAEHAVIGAALGKPDCIPEIMEHITPADFSNSNAARSFAIVGDLFREGKPVDIITVSSKERGLTEYLAKSTTVGYWENVSQYAKDIKESAKNRRILQKISQINRSDTSQDILRKLVEIYNSEAEAGAKNSDILSVMGRVNDCISQHRNSGKIGFDTGFVFLQNKMIQYAPGQVWVVGGYTSTGKTAMMIQMITNLFQKDKSAAVTVVSTEMTEEQLVVRLLGNLTGIYSQRVLAGNTTTHEQEAIEESKAYLKKLHLNIHEDIFSIEEIETAARKQNMRGGLDIMFIDYVQNCTVNGQTSEYQEQAALAKRIQKLAKDVSATVVCLSQVSNSVGRGTVDTFELKGAGEWAAICDIGVMLQRSKENDRDLKFEIRKNRHGAKCKQVFKYSSNFSKLEAIDN